MESPDIASEAVGHRMDSVTQIESDILDMFFSTEGPDQSKPEFITVDSSTARNHDLLSQHIDAIPALSKYLVVVINDSNCSKLVKLRNLFLRHRIVNNCERLLRKSNFAEIGKYALYPTLENVSLAYQTNSIAANYAETYLINETVTTPKRILNRIFKALSWGSPTIDVIAVVGTR